MNYTPEEIDALLPHKGGAEVKWACVAIELLMYLTCVPIFIQQRRKPVIFLRCWSLNIFVNALIIINKTAEACLSTSWIVNHTNLMIFDTISQLTISIELTYFHATFIRHYFILLRPRIQQQMVELDSQDADGYIRLAKKCEWVKMMASEEAAWTIWFIHSGIVTAIFFAYYSTYNPVGELFGIYSSFSTVQQIMLAFNPITGTILMFALIPRGASDNFNIGLQYTLLTFSVMFIVLLAVLLEFLPQTPFTNALTIFNDTVPLVILMACNLIIPIWPDSRFKLQKNGSNDPNKSDDHTPGVSVLAPSTIGQTTERKSVTLSQLPSRTTSLYPGAQTNDTGSAKAHGMKRSNTAKTNLDKILANPTLLMGLRKFMAKEFALEHLHFLEIVSSYKLDAEATESVLLLHERALKIYNEYIKEGALNQINVPYEIVVSTREVIHQMTLGGDFENLGSEFNEADNHVRNLLISDSVPRYIAFEDNRRKAKGKVSKPTNIK